MQQKRGRGQRGAQAKPTQAEIRQYWQNLKDKAAAGDIKAMETLLRLTGEVPPAPEGHLPPVDNPTTQQPESQPCHAK